MKKSNSEAIIIAKRINTFLNSYAPSQKTKSDHTLKSYQYALALYIEFLEKEKGITSEKLNNECFNVTVIEEWLIWLREKRECSPETCNNRLGSLRIFLEYLGRTEVSTLYLYEEATNIPLRKTLKKKVKGMSKKAIETLLNTPNVATKTGVRDLVLMLTLYCTAARIDEILSLKIEQLHLNAEKPNITLIGKGGKIRTMYLLPKAVAHIIKYLEDYHEDSSNMNAYLFQSKIHGVYYKLSQKAVSKRLRIHAKDAHKNCNEVPLELHAHQFRHARATHWLEEGMNIVQISFLLDHEQLQTTMVYLDITTEQELEALATLEDENDKSIPKKWKSGKGLAALCGVKKIV